MKSEELPKERTLSIHQRINAKNNLKVWHSSLTPERLMRLNYAKIGIYVPESLLLEAPGIHNQRNYDGPEPDYNCESAGERAEKMHRCQMEVK